MSHVSKCSCRVHPCFHDMTPEEQEAQRQSWVRGEMGMRDADAAPSEGRCDFNFIINEQPVQCELPANHEGYHARTWPLNAAAPPAAATTPAPTRDELLETLNEIAALLRHGDSHSAQLIAERVSAQGKGQTGGRRVSERRSGKERRTGSKGFDFKAERRSADRREKGRGER